MSAFKALGRRLRLGVVGGAPGALIGPVHRTAAQFDGCFEVVGGVLSSDPDKARAAAAELGLHGYDTVAELAEAVDAVAVTTPNHAHHAAVCAALAAGRDVICDKPLTNDLDEARDLVARVRASGLVFCLTHNYSGYPMVREARARVAAGELGPVRQVVVHYAQGTLAGRVEDGEIPARLRWRLDPKRGGASHVLGDIGTHAHQLAEYISGQRVARVCADVGAVVPGRGAHDTGNALLRFDGGAWGVMWTTKAAGGVTNALSIRVHGERGGIEWEQANPNDLRVLKQGEGVLTVTRGQPNLSPAAQRASRIPPAHPEGFYEAFANLYRDAAEAIAARLTGTAPDPLALDFPKVEDGARGVAFIDACLRSSQSGTWVDCEGAF